MRSPVIPIFISAIIGLQCSFTAAEAPRAPGQLAEMSIEQLLNVTVTSVARRSERLADSPAAVHVITYDELRRSGVRSIPEALRLAPGLNVARVNAHDWAISSRGFNDLFANKLLVLIDGRSVYTPLFSGVYWDVQDALLEDIDRIEVIRGPGAALWGANAVNGVINIISKRAAETQGTFVEGGGGTEERAFGAVRYGGKIGPDLRYRVYGKYLNRDDSALLGGSEADDAWESGRAGFRVDYEPAGSDRFNLQGDIYRGRADQLYQRLMPLPPFAAFESRTRDRFSGGNVIGRWTHTFSETSEFTLQTYFDRTTRVSTIFADERDTIDVDFQHRFKVGERQVIVWGGGYRHMADDTRSTFDIALSPARRQTDLYSAFVQDEIALVPEKLTLTLGTKIRAQRLHWLRGAAKRPPSLESRHAALRLGVCLPCGADSIARRARDHLARPSMLPGETRFSPDLLPP
jgi:iron complex outermembrane receptor protein